MPTTARYGQPITLKATVTSPSGTPTGTVKFTDVTTLCTATLVNGTGSCSPGILPVGAYKYVTAAYSGTTAYAVSYASISGGFAVIKSVTNTTASATPSTTPYGTKVSYSAQVVPTYSGTGITAPTGQVVFTSGSLTLCTGSLSSGGTASCSGNTPAPSASAVVTASYAGDGNYQGSAGTASMDVTEGQASVTSSLFRPYVTYGQTVTYYATATAPAATPTGSISFVTQGGIPLCTTKLSAGFASCTSNAAGPAGAITIFANYSGDANFAPITNSLATSSLLSVSPALPLVKVGVDPILSVFGSPVTYTARVWGGGSLAPTGTVTFDVNGTDLCSAPVVKFSASCSPMQAPGGIGYVVTGSYSGDDNYQAAQGKAIATVFAAPTSTAIRVSPNPAIYGQQVDYSATVTSRGTPTGTVNFTEGSTTLCSAELQAGKASCQSTIAPVALGAKVTANFAGTSDYAPSSAKTTLTVERSHSVVKADVEPASVAYRSPVSYQVVVSGQYAGAPTGSVTFMTGNTALCTATLSDGSGSCSSSEAPGGTDTIVATFDGDANFYGSSGSTFLMVTPAATTAGAVVDPVTVTYGDRVDYSATVHGPDVLPITGGTIQFASGSLVLCRANVSGSKASCFSDAARPGLSQTVTAAYGGTADYAPTQATTPLNVVQAATKTSVTVNPRTAVYASPITFGATVTAPAGYFQKGTAPSGSVTFSIGAHRLCAASISDGTGSCRASTAPAGAGQVVSAQYSGDEIYPPSSGTGKVSVVSGPGACSASSEGSASVPGGYWLTGANGAVYSCGDAPFYGSLVTLGVTPTHPIVGMAATPNGKGYWLVASDGGIFAFGDAAFYGSMGGHPLNKPIVSMAATSRGGYYEVASDGGIFSFGPGASFYGSMGGHPLNRPIVGMDTAQGGGYWLVASDGGIFAFGDAAFYGSMGGHPLNKPIVGMATAADGGYWLVASDGGIFSFGPGASFYGSMGSHPLNQPIVGMASSGADGYWLVASDGGIFCFGSARFAGSTGGLGVTDIEGMASA